MRKLFSFKYLVAVAVTVLAFTSCNGELETINQSDLADDTVDITLSASSFDFQTSPMTKAGLASGLYGVQIAPYGKEYINNEIHACWLTENLSDQSFKLKKGTTYYISVVYVPNGKEVLEGEDGVYGPPFMNGNGAQNQSPVLGHDIYYGGSVNINSASQGVAQRKGRSSWYVKSNLLSDVDVYYGCTQITAQNNMSLDINLYRCMFGLQIDVANLTEGKVHIYECDYTNTSYAAVQRNNGIVYTLTPQESSMDKALEFVYMPFGRSSEENIKNYKSTIILNIDYEYPDGTVVTLFHKKADVKRMVKYSFSFDLNDVLDTVTGNTGANIQDEQWTNANLDDAAPKDNPW